jgi:hypothetical protein
MRWIGRSNFLLGPANLLAFLAMARTQRSIAALSEEASSLREANRRLLVHRRALQHQLNRADLVNPFLEADSQVGGGSAPVRLETPRDIVLCRISTECPHCPENYRFLRELSESGVLVIGLATDTSQAVVERHWMERTMGFPVLVRARGSAIAIVPDYGTPTTVAISQGKVVFLEFGELAVGDQNALRGLTSSWAREKPLLPWERVSAESPNLRRGDPRG